MSRSKKSPKEQMFKIFNDIQTRTETKENLELFYRLYESTPIQDFNEALESIFLIIFYNYDKNNLALKNIKEFLKMFIENIFKNTKLTPNNRAFLKYFCGLFTLNAKKMKYKNLSLWFLSIFLIPYTKGHVLLYEATTLEDIKTFILVILKGKQSVLHMAVLQLLEKHPQLQKDTEIWERLEILLNGDNKNIKRAIIKLFENCNENISKYLLEMYDDDSSEIRCFAFEKLAKIQNYHSIDPKTKMKLFFIGLSDNNKKVQVLGKRLLKSYLNYLGIVKGKTQKDDAKDNDRMDIDDEVKHKSDDDDEDSINNKKTSTIKERLLQTTSPMKPTGKKLADSPSRIFDDLDVLNNYNHPKYSSVFTLITEAMIEIIDNEDLSDYLKDIIDNLSSITNRIGEIKQFSTEKKRVSQFSSTGKERVDKYALFNDVYFLQNCLTLFSQDKASEVLKSSIIDILPDGRTYSKILAHFYISSPNILILHQLLLIAQHMTYQDELGNREMVEFIKRFISDLSLQTKKVKDFSFRRLTFNRFDSKPDEFDYNEFYNNSNKDLNVEKHNEICLNNIFLPIHRRIILSMEDLVELNLEILKMINAGKDSQLFIAIMEVINDLKENLESEVDNSIKRSQNNLLEKLKDKQIYIQSIEERGAGNGQNRIKDQKDMIAAKKEFKALDDEFFELTQVEGRILYRIVKLCEFSVNHCHLPHNAFENMVTSFIISTLRRTQFPHVVHISLQITGLLAINHFNSSFRNFLKLFFDNLAKDDCEEFKDSARISLSIIFDSMLQNNLLLLPQEIINGTIDDKIKTIISKYLYHSSYTPRVMVFMGLCKLLLADRVTKHEFLLSRLMVALYSSFNIIDSQGEEYNVKIYEIMNQFVFFYSLGGKNHINSIIKSIEVIYTTQLLFSNENTYDRSVIGDFNDIKHDFLSQFLHIAYQNTSTNINVDYMKLIYKLFKFFCFLYKYAKEENKDHNIEKTASIGIIALNQLNNKMIKLFEKTHYDQGLYAFFIENDSFLKFYSFLYTLNEGKLLTNFSTYLSDEFKELKETKGNLIEINGTAYDLNSEERKKEMSDYVNKKEKKYYEMIEEYFAFGVQLKENKLKSLFKENLKILEEENDDEEEEESSRKKKKKNNKAKMIEEEEKSDKEDSEEEEKIKEVKPKGRKPKKDKQSEADKPKIQKRQNSPKAKKSKKRRS